MIKLTSQQIYKLAESLRACSMINLDLLLKRFPEFFPNATSVEIILGDEYNDQGYDYRVTDLKFKCDNDLLSLDEEDWRKNDKFYDFQSELTTQKPSSGEGDSFKIIIELPSGRIISPEIPDLYVEG